MSEPQLLPPDLLSLSKLPSVPQVAVRLMSVFADRDAGLTSIVEVLQHDPALTTEVLRAVNSAQLGIGRSVDDLDRAVVFLGRQRVISLALSFSLARESLNDGRFAQYYRDFWLQSVVQATTAEHIAHRYAPGQEAEYFVAGLLLDLGRLILLKEYPERYTAVIDQCRQFGRSLVDIEAKDLQITHVDLSASVLRQIGLSEEFEAAVRVHHDDPAERRRTDRRGRVELAPALQVAAAMGEYFCSTSYGLAFLRLHELASRLLDASEADIESLVHFVQLRVDETAPLLSTDVDNLESPLDLVRAAERQLSELAAADDPPGGGHRDDVAAALIRENRQLKRRIAELDLHSCLDPLTSVYNRRFFDRRLEETIRRAEEKGTDLGLLFLDLNDFKQINDQYGHLAGDQVLKRIAHAMQANVRRTDLVARYGGDEFVVLVDNTSLDGLERLSERLVEQVTGEVIDFEDQVFSASVSIGGVIARVTDAGDAEFPRRLLNSADSAMYVAKQRRIPRFEIRGLEAVPVASGTESR